MFGNVKSLRELFEIELRYAYDCEQKLVKKGLPTMIENASSPELRDTIKGELAIGALKMVAVMLSPICCQSEYGGAM